MIAILTSILLSTCHGVASFAPIAPTAPITPLASITPLSPPQTTSSHQFRGRSLRQFNSHDPSRSLQNAKRKRSKRVRCRCRVRCRWSDSSFFASPSQGNDDTHSPSPNSLPFFATPSSFAPPTTSSASTSSSSSPSSSAATPASSTPSTPVTITLRLPLGTLFDGRDYIFVTDSNVRGYEWTVKETDMLLDDLVDAALGTLGEQPPQPSRMTMGVDDAEMDAKQPQSEQQQQPQQPQQPIVDYELSQIVLVPTSDWNPSLLGLGNRYDVYDGQQRLVTLSLLLASLRDSFEEEANDLNEGKRAGGKRAVALAATAREISNMLVPTKVRKEDVVRITLRKREDVLLRWILMGSEVDSAEDDLFDDDGKDGTARDGEDDDDVLNVRDVRETPTQHFSKLTPHQTHSLLAPLSPTNHRILTNFLHLTRRISQLTTRERLRLLDYMVERVFLLVCIPETARIARNIVMAQGRKGLDNEMIDDFKGLVCFRYTVEEGEMYGVFDRWDCLAAEPLADGWSGDHETIAADSADAIGSIGSIESVGSIEALPPPPPVGRETVSAACLLRASAALRTKLRTRGGDEVYELEKWLRQELWIQNQYQIQSSQTSQSSQSPQSDKSNQSSQPRPWQGTDFYLTQIEPASLALYKFRNAQWDQFRFLPSQRKSRKKEGENLKRDTMVSRLNFIREVILAVPSAKEGEIVVLEYLLRAEACAAQSGKSGTDGTNGKETVDGTEDHGVNFHEYLDLFLQLIEQWTLWMAIVRPSPMQRHARVLELLDTMDDPPDFHAIMENIHPISMSLQEREELNQALDECEFGASAGGRRLAAAILKRVNAHVMQEEGNLVGDSAEGGKAVVDAVLPVKRPVKGSDFETLWLEEEKREEWVHRIGNLVLISSGPSSRRVGKAKNGSSWENKKKSYKKESWALTKQCLEFDKWDWGTVQEQQKVILQLIGQVWSLNTNDTL